MSVEELAEKARELRKKGMSLSEIADELNLQVETVSWLLLHEKKKEVPAPFDYYVDWSGIGRSTRRVALIAWALADMMLEEIKSGRIDDVDVVLGVEPNGIPLATLIAEEMEKDFAIVRVKREEGKASISPNFSRIRGKRILVVDDVISRGITLSAVVKSVKATAKPVAIAVIVNKTGVDDIEGVPVYSLIKVMPFRPSAAS